MSDDRPAAESSLQASTVSHSDFRSLPRRQLVGTIVGLQLTLLLAALDQTIVSTAMPQIIARLNGFDRYTWVTTAYLLTSTAAVPILGKLSDMYGRKRILLDGALFFVLTSALCGAAGQLPLPLDGMTQLIVGRGLQGIAGGAIMACVFSSLGDIFPPLDRGKYMGLFAGVWGLSSMLGPALGGWLTDAFSWRWIFYVNLPFGVLAISCLQVYFPDIKPDSIGKKIDYLGAFSLIAFLIPLLTGLTAAASVGWTATPVLVAFLFSLCAFVFFVCTELRASEPIVPPLLLQIEEIRLALLIVTLTSVAMFDVVLFAPLYLQAVLCISATKAGSLFTPLTLTMSIMSTTSGQLISRWGRYKYLALIGLSVTAVGLLLLASYDRVDSTGTCFALVLTMIGAGLGATMPIFTISIQNAAPQNMIGAATALSQFCRSIGATVGAAVLGSVMQGTYLHCLQKSSTLVAALPNEVTRVVDNPARFVQMKSQLLARYVTLGNGDPYNLQQLYGNIAFALGDSIHLVFLLGAITVLVALVATCFVKEKQLRAE